MRLDEQVKLLSRRVGVLEAEAEIARRLAGFEQRYAERAHSSDCEQRFRFKANAVPVETEQMPVGSTCGRCSVVKWPSWRPGHLTGYDIFARLFL
jgi:hypothetical protein